MLVAMVIHLRPAGLGDDLGLARVLLGVEHLVGELVLAEQPGKQLRVLDRKWCRPAPAGRARSSP